MASVTKRARMFAIMLMLIDEPTPFDDLATWERHLADVRRLPDDVVLKPELIKTAKETIESRTNRSYLPDTRAGDCNVGVPSMGMITVAIDGESIFTWDGDEAAVKHVLEDFPHGAASVGMTPRALADNCVAHLSKGLRVGDEEQGQVGQEMQMMGVIWHILEAETYNAEHPGKIADYAGAVDFLVDLRTTDQGFTAQVTAQSKFDA